MQAADVLTQMLKFSELCFRKSTSDLSDDQWFFSPAEELQCPAWLIGHAALIDRQILQELAERLEGGSTTLPDLPEGWQSLFSICVQDANLIRSFEAKEVNDFFLAQRQGLIDLLMKTPDTVLDQTLEDVAHDGYNPLRRDAENVLFQYRTVGEMVRNMCFYGYELTGELAVIRQSLGLPDVDEDLL